MSNTLMTLESWWPLLVAVVFPMVAFIGYLIMRRVDEIEKKQQYITQHAVERAEHKQDITEIKTEFGRLTQDIERRQADSFNRLENKIDQIMIVQAANNPTIVRAALDNYRKPGEGHGE
jgi:hypothetical protein